jgi:hypothetical protein
MHSNIIYFIKGELTLKIICERINAITHIPSADNITKDYP